MTTRKKMYLIVISFIMLLSQVNTVLASGVTGDFLIFGGKLGLPFKTSVIVNNATIGNYYMYSIVQKDVSDNVDWSKTLIIKAEHTGFSVVHDLSGETLSGNKIFYKMYELPDGITTEAQANALPNLEDFKVASKDIYPATNGEDKDSGLVYQKLSAFVSSQWFDAGKETELTVTLEHIEKDAFGEATFGIYDGVTLLKTFNLPIDQSGTTCTGKTTFKFPDAYTNRLKVVASWGQRNFTRDASLILQQQPTVEPKFNLVVNAGTGGSATGGGQYTKDQKVGIVATPTAEYKFSKWVISGKGSVTNSTLSSTTFTMPDEDTVITAEFEKKEESKKKYTVTLKADKGGTVGKGGEYEVGSTVSITASPSSGYYFDEWTGSDASSMLRDEYREDTTFTMPSRNVTLTAEFTDNDGDYKLKVTSEDGGKIVNNTSKRYSKNDKVNIEVEISNGYEFDRWEIVTRGGKITDESRSKTTFTMPDNDSELIAKFKKHKYKLTITSLNGTVNGGGEFSTDAIVNISTSSNQGYEFKGWKGVEVSALGNATANSTTFKMPAKDTTIVAEHAIIPVVVPTPTPINIQPTQQQVVATPAPTVVPTPVPTVAPTKEPDEYKGSIVALPKTGDYNKIYIVGAISSLMVIAFIYRRVKVQ